jgi:hypothetical protein
VDDDSRKLADCIFLAVVVGLSFILYAGKLGFYSDDWAFLGSLHSFGNFSNAGRSTIFDFGQHIHQRPTQGAYTWLLFRLFGLNPLGYHVVNGLVVIGMTVLLYLLLREIGAQRMIAVSSAAVFSFFPAYSTDRFWLAAFGYTLSMATYFLSVNANLHALRGGRWLWAWKALAVSALLISGFGYEVVLPLFLATIAMLWYLARRMRRSFDQGQKSRFTPRRLAVFLGVDLVALALVVAYKAVVSPQTGVPADYPRYLLWLITGSITMHYGVYGLGLPQAVRWSLGTVAWPVIGVGSLMASAMFAYLLVVGRRSRAALPNRKAWLKIAVAGFVLFLLGYSIFLINARLIFTATGINNRVAIAASLGTALSIVGVFGWMSTWVGTAARRRGVFSALVSLMCLSGFLVVNALGVSWGQAWDREQLVLTDIRAHVAKPPPESAIILDGVCPYIGPAIVFESNWDLSGALEVIFTDPTIRADVSTADLKIGPDGLSTTLYGTHSALYRYGERLSVYDFGRSIEVRLPDVEAARAYFSRTESGSRAGCAGRPGVGISIFPIENRLRQLEISYFSR